MAMIIEDGISDKSFTISAVATVTGFIMLIGCLEWSKHGLPDWAQIILSIINLAIFGLGFAGWAGYFDKKKPVRQSAQSVPVAPLAPPKTWKQTRLERKVEKLVDKELKNSKWGMNKDGE